MLVRLKSALNNPQSAILLICLVAFALRLGPLFDNRFHPDEALFSTWAMKIARGENLLLTSVPVDKPPLLIYLSALSFFIFGQSELAARVPNLIASVISVPLLYQLTKNLTPGPSPENVYRSQERGVRHSPFPDSALSRIGREGWGVMSLHCCLLSRPSLFSLPRRPFSIQ